MNEIERRIIASQGYRELGLLEDARAELAHLPSEMQQRADVVEIRALCYMDEKRWHEALECAVELSETDPTNPGGFIHAAFCLHELGRTQEAVRVLNEGPTTLRSKAVYFYNQACYHACLGLLEDAGIYLQRALEKDPQLRKAAAKDPDLAAIKHQLL